MEKDSVTKDSEEKGEKKLCLMDFPDEILGSCLLIPLPLKDRIRFLAVCKRLRSIALPMESPKTPWLLFREKKKDGICKFFDPLRKSTYVATIPDFSDTMPRHSKYGWVLLSRLPCEKSWFFFNPFTSKKIDLPDILSHRGIYGVSFSSPPTSTDCVVFAIQSFHHSYVEIYTWRHGNESWIRFEDIENNRPFLVADNNPVFYKGNFYCLGMDGSVGVFDIAESTWRILVKPTYVKKKAHNCFLVESSGELLSVFTGTVVNPIHVFRLDNTCMTWVEVKSLGERTVFVSQETSICATMGLKEMENKIYFPRFRIRSDGEDDDMVFCCSMDTHISHFDTKAYAFRTWIDPTGYVFEFHRDCGSQQFKFIRNVESPGLLRARERDNLLYAGNYMDDI